LSFINDHADVFYLAVAFFTLGLCVRSTKPLLWAAVILLVDFFISNLVHYLNLYTTANNIVIDAVFALAYLLLWANYQDKLFLWMLGLTLTVMVWHFANAFIIEKNDFVYALVINLLFFAKASYIWKARYAETS